MGQIASTASLRKHKTSEWGKDSQYAIATGRTCWERPLMEIREDLRGKQFDTEKRAGRKAISTS